MFRNHLFAHLAAHWARTFPKLSRHAWAPDERFMDGKWRKSVNFRRAGKADSANMFFTGGITNFLSFQAFREISVDLTGISWIWSDAFPLPAT